MMPNALTPEGSVLVHTLGWALLHSLWQGALISGCLWLLLRLLDQSGARLRYHLSLAALLLLVGSFASTCIRQWQRLQSVVVYVTESGADTGIPRTHSVIAAPVSAGSWLPGNATAVERLFPWLVALYSAGLLVMLLRFFSGIGGVYRLRARQIVHPDAPLQNLFNRLCLDLQISGPVRLLLSASAQVPVALGMLKPLVLLPVSMVTSLSAAQLEAILIHELAHIRRQDYLINILQTVFEIILFFNPFLWWISAGIRREREHCCDDLVLAQTLQPLQYAAALAVVEASRVASVPLALGAAGNSKHQLFNRIKRLTEMNRTSLNYGRLTAGIVATCAVAGAIIWFTPAFAQDKKEPVAKATRVQKVIVIDDQGNKKEYNSLDELPAEAREKVHESLSKADVNMAGLDQQLAVLGQTMSGMDTALDGEKLSALISGAMKSVDWNSINQTTKAAMAQAGNALIIAGKEMKQVDWNQINHEIASAMEEVDQLDWRAVANAAKAGQAQALIIADDARERAADAADEAREAADDARDRRERTAPPAPPALPHGPVPPAPPAPPAPKSYDAMLDEMDADGLIDRSGRFDIRKDSRDLFINGQAQPDDVKVKYRHFFSPGEVNISGSKHRLNISSTMTTSN